MSRPVIASVSFGKDSLAMVHLMIESGQRLDEVVFYDTGAEFDAIYRESSKELPLVEAGMTEADCLGWCYERGHTWDEDGVRLYDVFDRVSCWCCRNKNLKELAAMSKSLPRYYERLEALEETIGEPMKKGHTLEEIRERACEN